MPGSRPKARQAHSPSQVSAFTLAEDEGDGGGTFPRAKASHRKRLSPCPPISTIPNAKPPRTPARSPAWMFCASSTSRRRRRWPMASTSATDRRTIAVYDLGGGTFDISILEIGDGVFEVKSTNGDTFLGGEDFDQRIIQYLADEFKKEQGIDLTHRQAGPAAPERGRGERPRSSCPLRLLRPRSICPTSPPMPSGPKHLNAQADAAPSWKSLVDDLVERTIETRVASRLEGRRRLGRARSRRSSWSAA